VKGSNSDKLKKAALAEAAFLLKDKE